MRQLALAALIMAALSTSVAYAKDPPGCPVVGIKSTGEFYQASERKCFKNANKAANKGFTDDDNRSGLDGWNLELTGSEEVPPVITSSSGDCLAVLKSDGVTLAVSCAHTANSTAAHVHVGAIGVDGSVICTLTSTSPIFSECALSEENLASLKAGELYFNIHTSSNPDGELRGQID